MAAGLAVAARAVAGLVGEAAAPPAEAAAALLHGRRAFADGLHDVGHVLRADAEVGESDRERLVEEAPAATRAGPHRSPDRESDDDGDEADLVAGEGADRVPDGRTGGRGEKAEEQGGGEPASPGARLRVELKLRLALLAGGLPAHHVVGAHEGQPASAALDRRRAPAVRRLHALELKVRRPVLFLGHDAPPLSLAARLPVSCEEGF
jgi:hypothetical protein